MKTTHLGYSTEEGTKIIAISFNTTYTYNAMLSIIIKYRLPHTIYKNFILMPEEVYSDLQTILTELGLENMKH